MHEFAPFKDGKLNGQGHMTCIFVIIRSRSINGLVRMFSVFPWSGELREFSDNGEVSFSKVRGWSSNSKEAM